MEDLPESMFGYILFVDEDYGILGLPKFDNNPAYMGHFANDGANMPKRESELASYVLESNAIRNAMHQGISGDSHMVTVATCNIAAGDEIFVTYGPDYWREQPTFVDDDGESKDNESVCANGRGFG